MLTALIALAGAALPPARPAPAGTASAAMSVGAVVVRDEPASAPAVAVEGGAVVVRGLRGPSLTAEGGSVGRAPSGAIVVTPGAAGRVTLTLTY